MKTLPDTHVREVSCCPSPVSRLPSPSGRHCSHYMVAVSGTDHIPCIPYYTFGSPELADGVSKGIRESKSLLMQHHGMLAMDVTLEKTLWLAGETETLADLYIKCGGLHHDVPVLSEAEMTIVLEKFKTYGLKVTGSFKPSGLFPPALQK
ncbi:class II aldolase/adducin family protein [Escherichia coli]